MRDGNVPYEKRAKTQDKDGNPVLKFISRAAVYVIDKSVVQIESINKEEKFEED